MKRLLTPPTVLFLLTACSATPTVSPTRNLESPSDMTFVCLKTDGGTLSGQPMSACHGRNVREPPASVNGQRVLGTFAFITNPGRNELAVADMDLGRLLDLAPLTPGYGMLPLGNDPEVIAASPDGCWVVTANRTSCDFTMVDPSRLLAGAFTSGSTVVSPVTAAGDVSRRITVRTSSGVLAASIGEVAFLPSASSTCADPTATAPAVATFPGCDMVALLDFSFSAASATVVDAYYVRSNGLVPAGSDPVCPTECGPGGVDAGAASPEAGVVSAALIDGGVAPPSMDGGSGGAVSYLQALALVPDGSRVYVGSLSGDSVASFDVSPQGFANPNRVVLAESPGGVRRLRLNVDPYATVGNVEGKFLDDRGKFLYAFTNDDSVRVINIDSQPVECDVNLLLDSADQQPCHPVGQPGFRRRPLAQGPGLRIPITTNPDSTPPVPLDISFSEFRPPLGDLNYQSLSGQFGFLLASNGQVYVVNLAPQPAGGGTPASLGTSPPSMTTHSFREYRDVGKSGGPALAMSVVPQRAILATNLAFPATANYSALDGPLIQPFSNDTPRRYLDFPDLNTVVSPSWNVTWEGALPNASRTTGLVTGRKDESDPLAGVLNDKGADFCSSGVQVGDIVMFSGCTQDEDCQPDDQFTCQVTVSGGPRLCLPRDPAASANVAQSCAVFLGSRVRYEVAAVSATSLQLQLKLDEIPKTTLNPCQQNSDCLAGNNLVADTPDGGGISKGFECLAVREGENRRCVKRCVHDSDCRPGNVCQKVPGTLFSSVGNLCVEAPPIVEACFPQSMVAGSLQPTIAYSVLAGHAFTVSGSLMPSLSPLKRTPSGACAAQPLADPSLVARIPLSAPRCPDAFIAQASPATGLYVEQLNAQPGSNPCLYSGVDGSVDGATASANNPIVTANVRAFYQNPQIRFVLSNLNQYAGDLLSIHFEFQYGYTPLTAYNLSYEVLLTMGTRIITGPTQTPESPLWSDPNQLITYPYLYVVDQGKTALTAGSHGQVLRVNPRSGSTQIISFDNTLSGSTPFQIQ
jgi:hypothetical protein